MIQMAAGDKYHEAAWALLVDPGFVTVRIS